MPPIVGVQLREPLAAATGVPGLSTWRTHGVCTHFCRRSLCRNRTKLLPVPIANSDAISFPSFHFAHAALESRCLETIGRVSKKKKKKKNAVLSRRCHYDIIRTVRRKSCTANSLLRSTEENRFRDYLSSRTVSASVYHSLIVSRSMLEDK